MLTLCFVPTEPALLERVTAYAAQLFITFSTTAADFCAAERAWLADVLNDAAWRRVEALERRLDELRAEDLRTHWLIYWLRLAECCWRFD